MKAVRHRSREFALQGVYQWLVAKNAPSDIAGEIALFRGFDKCDPVYFRELLDGVAADAATIDESLTPHLDRPITQLAPIEHAVLMLAAREFTHHLDVPYRVIINEAVELAKTFGGADGHKFVNGVLDKLAPALREAEVRAAGEERRTRKSVVQ